MSLAGKLKTVKLLKALLLSSDTDENWNGFNLYANPQGQFIFNVGGNGTTTAIVSDPQQEDVWYNVTATLDQQLDLIRLYINGLLIGESDIENSWYY